MEKMLESSNLDKLKDLHLMEEHRVASFRDWPFDEQTSCSIAKMAEAGFYWSGNERENDTVTCFVCAKTLDGWEATDDPWKEHGKHAPQCSFVKYGRKESELTLEEFLKLFVVVLKNHTVQNMEKKKKEVTSMGRNVLKEYLEKK